MSREQGLSEWLSAERFVLDSFNSFTNYTTVKVCLCACDYNIHHVKNARQTKNRPREQCFKGVIFATSVKWL